MKNSLLKIFLLLPIVIVRTEAMNRPPMERALEIQGTLASPELLLVNQDQIIRSMPLVEQRTMEIAIIQTAFDTSKENAEILTLIGELRRISNPPLHHAILALRSLQELINSLQAPNADPALLIYCLSQRSALITRIRNAQHENHGSIADEVMM